MKGATFASLMVFGVLVAFLEAATVNVNVGVGGGKCIEQDACPDGQCCSGVPPFGGYCQPLTTENARCKVNPKTVPIFGDFYIGACPCAEGLECVPKTGAPANEGLCKGALNTTSAPSSA